MIDAVVSAMIRARRRAGRLLGNVPINPAA